jgi:cobalt-zinc-cadmium efflux system protein
MVAEIVVGYASGSLALLSDAGHMLTDAGALGLAIWAQSLATRARSGQKTFGYRRAEILAAAANGIVLGVAAVAVVIEALARLRSKPPVEGGPMLAVAVGGLVVNLISAWVLARGEGHNLNLRVAAAHVLADAAGSVAAIVAAVLILAFGWTLADPITSIVISVLILVGAWRLLRDTTNVLMEGTPASIDVGALERGIAQVPGVSGVHDLHVWSIAGDTPVVTVHVVIGEGRHGVDVARAVAALIISAIGKAHVTVQPEAPAPGDVLLPSKSLLPR